MGLTVANRPSLNLPADQEAGLPEAGDRRRTGAPPASHEREPLDRPRRDTPEAGDPHLKPEAPSHPSLGTRGYVLAMDWFFDRDQ